jgi:phosphatidylglycerol---prolipoprotein diacylglyceryl transferase
MYPDLSYFFHDIFGSQPDNWLSIFKTFGFVLALAFLASALFYFLELKRKAEQGFLPSHKVKIRVGALATTADLVSSGLAGLLLGGKILYAFQHADAFKVDPASIILSGKMNWVGAILGAFLAAGSTWFDAWRKRKPEPIDREITVWPHHLISEMTVWAAVGGIFGAKIFDMLDNWESTMHDPWGALASGGGLAIYGGLLGGFITVVSFILSKKIPLLHAMDACAPALVMGYAVGRVGCQLSGDGDWGLPNLAQKPNWLGFLPDWMWSFDYPRNVLGRGYFDDISGNENVKIATDCAYQYCYKLAQPVWPTPFYETILALIVFGILWSIRKKIAAPGVLFMIYLFLIGLERIIVEQIRVNVVHDWFGMKMTQAELISGILMIVGSIGSFIFYQKYRRSIA